MNIQVFYAPDINEDFHVLDENESKHIVRVLRMKKGMSVKLIDGKGNLYEGEIADDNTKKCIIKITGIVKDYGKRNYRLHLAVSPLKNTDRFEWLVEKIVEIGVDEITPLLCHNTEKQKIKRERTDNIIVSAMKQSLKTTKTYLNEPVTFGDFISSGFAGKKIIAHCNNSFNRNSIQDVYKKDEDVLILIGPEGDFTEEEIIRACNNGFAGVHLGASRFRTETAGIAACYSIYSINQ